jgi:subtilisin family serine protease
MRDARWARRLAALAAVVAMAFAGGASVGANASTGSPRERYIVVLRDSVSSPGAVAAEHSRADGVDVDHIYQSALKGYAGTMSAAAAENISHDPRVDHVEADQVVSIAQQEMPTGVDRIDSPDTNNSTSSHLGIDGTDDQRVDVDVAVIDTGVDSSHPDLNVLRGTDCTGSPLNQKCVDTASPTDGNGHATHVAGTIGALDNGIGVVGVAPGARIWSVRVLNSSGSGYMSWIVAGIDWVDAHASEIEVANMSLGCQCSSTAMDTAIDNAVSDGVTFAVAAGNDAMDANNFSPANNPNVIAVSALADFNGRSGGGAPSTCRSDQDDTLADFSNYGSTVDIAAPGVCILSTWPGGGYNTISGTSMASPHVAGAAALLMSGNSTMTPDGVKKALQNSGNVNWGGDPHNANEKLLDVSTFTVSFTPTGSGGGGGGGSSANQPPTVSTPTKSCGGATCTFNASASDPDNGPSALTYSWSFGDGTSGSGNPVSHKFGGTSATTYTVRVTVSDGADGASAQTTVVCSGKGKSRTCS